MEDKDFIKAAFDSLTGNNDFIIPKDLNKCLKEVKPRNKFIYDIVLKVSELTKNITLDVFRNFFEKKFCSLSNNLPNISESIREYESFSDLNAINKYNFLCWEYNNGEVLDVEALVKIKKDIESVFHVELINKMLEKALEDEEGVLDYEDFKSIVG